LCQWLHENTKEWGLKYKLQLKRHYYVTPTSYIELISCFKAILAEKRKLNKQLIYKYENGYVKIIETEKAVEEMKINLEEMKPVLRRAAEETLTKMEQVADQKKEADIIM
jgi:dynein heavy chain